VAPDRIPHLVLLDVDDFIAFIGVSSVAKACFPSPA